jgi:hypothetical protein
VLTTPLPPELNEAMLRAFYGEEEYAARVNGHTPGEPDPDLLLDWAAFWAQKREEAEWLAEPILPAKRLLALWLAAGLATGARLLSAPTAPINVLYLDYEMTEDDLAERLENMGYGPHSDLSRLHYALLPSLPGLDEPEGGKAVVELARSVGAQLVVIDTFGRAVHGDENEADTVRAWYRWTGLNLKAEGRAFVRVDHAGKDLDKGQRGTSAKNDDVDVVWRLARQDGDTFRLTAKKRRMSWVPEVVDIVMREDPHLAYGLLGGPSYPAGTKEVADTLDELGVPLTATRRVASDALKSAGNGARTLVVSAALKWRREASSTLHVGPASVHLEQPVRPLPGSHLASPSLERLPTGTGGPDADQGPLAGPLPEGGDLTFDLSDGPSSRGLTGRRILEGDDGIHVTNVHGNRRREQPNESDDGNNQMNQTEPSDETPGQEGGTGMGTNGNQESARMGTGGPPLRGTPFPVPPADEPDDDKEPFF